MQVRNSHIAFTGFKNVGGERNRYYAFRMNSEDTDLPDSKRSIDNYVVSMELTDEDNGKDLTTFKREVMKSDIEDGYHDFNINFMHLNILKPNSKEYGNVRICLNDSEVEIKDENLNILSFIAQTLQRVADTPAGKLILNKNFLEESYEAPIMINSLCMNYPEEIPSREDLTDEDNQKIQDYYDKNNAKEVCNGALKAITDRMIDYFS